MTPLWPVGEASERAPGTTGPLPSLRLAAPAYSPDWQVPSWPCAAPVQTSGGRQFALREQAPSSPCRGWQTPANIRVSLERSLEQKIRGAVAVAETAGPRFREGK